MKFNYFLLIFLLLVNVFSLQAQDTPFSKFFGENNLQEKGIASLQLEDGSILMLGNVASTETENGNISLSKLSPAGDLRWTKTYGTDENDSANNMTWMEDGNIAIVAESHTTNGSDANGLVLKVDTEGNVIWATSYGLANRTESFYSIDQTTENGLIIAGFVTGSGFGNDHYAVRLDGNGNVIWAKAYGGETNEVGVAIRQTADGSYILVGDKQNGVNGPYGIEVLRLDVDGKKVWELDVNGFENGGCKNMILDSNGDVVIVGEAFPTKNEAFDVLLAKVSSEGEIIWQKFIDGTPNGDAGFDLMELEMGGYMVVGYGFNPSSEQTDVLVSQVDVNGEEIETRYLGGDAFDIAYDIIPTLDGGFLITGFGFVGEDSQYFLAYDFPTVVGIEESELFLKSTIGVFPNPIAAGQLLQTSYSDGGTVEFFDLHGRLLDAFVYTSLKEIEVPYSLIEGIYILKLTTKEGIFGQKVTVF